MLASYDLRSPVTREEILSWLDGSNFRAIHRVALSTRMNGTGTWFLETFEFGELVKGKGVIVWGTGLPGSGKTILASISIEYLEDEFSGRHDIAIVYAYLRFSDHPKLRDIIAGLLGQLVKAHEAVFAHMKPIYRRYKEAGDDLMGSDAIELFREIVELLSKVFVVIDGLDEVDDHVKEALLSALASMRVNLLITSRPLDLFTCHTPNAFQVSIQARTEDIEIYVRTRIGQSARLKAILRGNENLVCELTERIKLKSQGMFLLARLQLEAVMQRSKSIASLFTILEGLPTGVDEMYRDTLKRINAQPGDDVSIAHRVFVWLTYSFGPLSVEDLLQALATSSDNLVFVPDDLIPMALILSMCGGLVTVEKDTDTVHFIHYSAKEFMTTVEFPDVYNPHSLLAITCVVQVEELMTSGGQDSKDPRWHTSPLVRYASTHWGHHAKICHDLRVLHPLIPSFLSRHPTHYYMPTSSNSSLGIALESGTGLHLATFYGLTDVILSGILSYTPQVGTQTPFHVAVNRNQPSTLQALRSKYRGVNIRNDRGNAPLHKAVWHGNEPLVKQLLSTRAEDGTPLEVLDINIQNRHGETPLLMACCLPNQEIVHLIASYPDVDPNIRDVTGRTAFYMACRWDSDETAATTLISSFQNLEVDVRDPWRGNLTAFMQACRHGLTSTVQWFLSRKCPGDPDFVQQKDREGRTAFEQVIALDDTLLSNDRVWEDNAIVGSLLAHGSCVRMPAIPWSVLGQREDANARLSRVRDVRRARASAVSRKQFPGAVDHVAVQLNDVTRRYGQGQTALMLAAGAGSFHYIWAITYLLSLPDIDDYINARDEDGRSALMYSCFWGSWRAMDILLSHPSINIHIRDHRGLSLLEYVLDRFQRGCGFPSESYLPSLFNHATWTLPLIRGAVINAVNTPGIESGALSLLFEVQKVEAAFVWDFQIGSLDTVLLICALHRKCLGGILSKVLRGCGVLPLD